MATDISSTSDSTGHTTQMRTMYEQMRARMGEVTAAAAPVVQEGPTVVPRDITPMVPMVRLEARTFRMPAATITFDPEAIHDLHDLHDLHPPKDVVGPGPKGLKSKVSSLLSTVVGRELFEGVFGKGLLKKEYKVPKEARKRISEYGLGPILRDLIARSVSPRILMAFVEGVSDPEDLNRVLADMTFGGPSRGRGNIQMIEPVAASTKDMRNDWSRYVKWERGTHRPHNVTTRGWVYAVRWKVAKEHQDSVKDVLRKGLQPWDTWAVLPKGEVIQIVRMWVQGEVWLRTFNGRNELDKGMLVWAYLRMKYLPDYPAGELRGVVDIALLSKSSTTGHIEQGHSTTETGYNVLADMCIHRQDGQQEQKGKKGVASRPTPSMRMRRRMIAMLEDEDEMLKQGVIKELVSRRARQVLVFRIAQGTVLWMDKSKRMVQLGPSPSMFSWRLGDFGTSLPIAVIAASTLGYTEGVWGWATIIHGGELLLVVPDLHWDAMVPLWEAGYVMWSQMIEAGGMPGYVQKLPQWNGVIGDWCFGGGNLSGYSMRGGRGTNSEISRIPVVGLKGRGFWEQPRIACMMQDGSFSWEAMNSGSVRVYVPVYGFLKRMEALVLHLKKEVWGLGLPVDVEFAAVTQSVRRIIQMICQYGERDVWWWQYPVCGPRSKMWWWALTDTQGSHVEGIGGYNPLKEMERLTSLRRLRYSGQVWDPASVKEDKEGGYFVGDVMESYWRIWMMGYKPVKIGVDEGRALTKWENSDDKAKSGYWLDKHGHRKKEGWKVPPRIQGTTPTTTAQQLTLIRQREDMLKTPGWGPRCGEVGCMEGNCNDGGGLNESNGGRVTAAWNRVPTDYIEWTKV